MNKKTIAIGLAGLAFGAGGGVIARPAVDCMGQTCVVETQYNEQGSRGQIKYTPEEYNQKTEKTIKEDIQKRIDEKKRIIEEQSKKEQPDEEPI